MSPTTKGCMTTSSKTVRPGEIWLTYLHFSDKPELGKVRPVLVVDAQQDSTIAVALKVTSKAPHDERVCIALDDWATCGLRKPSYVRLDQIFEVATNSLLRDEPLGSLSPDPMATILQRLESAQK